MLTPAHKLLLSTFAVRRPLYWLPDELHFSRDVWHKILAEDPFDVVMNFLQHGLIEKSSLADHISYVLQQTVAFEQFRSIFTESDSPDDQFIPVTETSDFEELLELLREYDLPTGRNERFIIQALIQNVEPSTLWHIVERVQLVELSTLGISIVNEYLSELQRTNDSDFQKRFGVVSEQVKFILSFVAGAALTGIIGNRIDAALLVIIEHIKSLFLRPKEWLGKSILDVEPTDTIGVIPPQNISAVSAYSVYDPISVTAIAVTVIFTRIVDVLRKRLSSNRKKRPTQRAQMKWEVKGIAKRK